MPCGALGVWLLYSLAPLRLSPKPFPEELRKSSHMNLFFSGEVPVMVDSARKELECPICMEVMMPPARIWQCKVIYNMKL